MITTPTTGLGTTDASSQQAGVPSNERSNAPGGAMGKDEFLRMLVTQLKNQDPLNPMDGQEFAAQLAQFTSVEQLVNINAALSQSAEVNGVLAQSINSGVAAGLIGKSVRAVGDTIGWDGEHSADLHFEIATPAENVTVHVLDESGRIVREIELGRHAGGKHSFQWDGTTSSGATAAAGTYTFDVSASDAGGDTVEAQTFTHGTVDRISFGQDGIRLWLGSYSIPMSDVESVE